jgi:hypothetical protein
MFELPQVGLLPLLHLLDQKTKLLAYGQNPQANASVVAVYPLFALLPSICQLRHSENCSLRDQLDTFRYVPEI